MSESMGFRPRVPLLPPTRAIPATPRLPPSYRSWPRHHARRRGPCRLNPSTARLSPSQVRALAHSHPLCITFYPVPHLSPTSTFAERFPTPASAFPTPIPTPLFPLPRPPRSSRSRSVPHRLPGKRPYLTTSVPAAPPAPLAHPAPPPHRSQWHIGRHRSCPMALRLRTTPAHAARTGHPTRPARTAPRPHGAPSGHQCVPPHPRPPTCAPHTRPPHAASPRGPLRTWPPRVGLHTPPHARPSTRRPLRPPHTPPHTPPHASAPNDRPDGGHRAQCGQPQRHHRRNRFSLSQATPPLTGSDQPCVLSWERVEGVSRSLPFSDLLALTSSHMFLSVMD
jgi:hypothetical protein